MKHIVLFFCCTIPQLINSQNDSGKICRLARHHIYLEAGHRASFPISYEYIYLQKQSVRLSIQSGAFAIDLINDDYPRWWIYIGNAFLYGKRKHFFEFTPGITYNSLWSDLDKDTIIGNSFSPEEYLNYHFLIGYRYQLPKKGLVLRAGYVSLFGKYTDNPSHGCAISIGFSFYSLRNNSNFSDSN